VYRHFCFGHHCSIFIKQTTLFRFNKRISPVQLSHFIRPIRALFRRITSDWSFLGGLLAPLD